MNVETQGTGEISFEDFLKVRIVTGTIVEAALNPKARVPAFVLEIDFGMFGRRKSSAQLTRNYTAESLVGKQIVAVVNFPPKRVAGAKSDVLILGAMSDDSRVVLL